MKKNRAVLGLIVVISFSWSGFVRAEEPPKSFEERHADKPFIVLLKEDEIRLNADWSFTHQTRHRLLIQKENAKDLGEIPIQYDRDYDRIIRLQAWTLTPDGNKHSPQKVQDMSVYDGEPMYSNAMVRVLSMPAVGVGAVIDLSYTIASKGMTMKNAFWAIESVDSKTPVKEYRYTFTFPKKLGIRYREFGLTRKPEITEKNGMVTYRWDLNDLYDDKQGEEYTPPPSPDDSMEAFEFSSVNSWDDFARWYSGLIDKNTAMTSDIIAAAKAAVGDKELVREKVRAVLEYVQDNFRYVSMSFGENAFEPHSTKVVFTNKYGDCKDLSLLTRAMLASVGVKADLALFNREDSINDPSFDLPIPALFDHALLLVEDPLAGDFYADPLLKGYDIGEYPMNFQRAYTFVINKGKGRFGRLPEFDAKRAAEHTSNVIDINEDWSGAFEVSSVWDLDASIKVRDRVKAMSEEQKKEMYETLDFKFARGGEVMERNLEGLEHRYGRLRSTIRFRRPDEFPSADGLVVIDLELIERDEAFEKKDRREAFFFSANGTFETEEIYRLPKGFEVFYVPSDIRSNGPYMNYSRVFQRTPIGVKINTSVQLKRLRLEKGALQELKEFHSNLSRQTRQRVVFKKKEK